jgi:two-component system KDP operon response regulator KdpE
MSAPLILVVDDEPAIRGAMTTLLRTRGYAVIDAPSGTRALEVFAQEQPALVILDLGLPDIDGAEVCARMRGRSSVPIVVLSVRSDERSKVAALDAGADDYVTKPFSPEELLARLRSALRRALAHDAERRGQLQAGDLLIDFDRRRVNRDGGDIRLTPKEFDLLTLLASQSGRVLTHKRIARTIWGGTGSGQQEHLRVLVGQLRKKLEPDPAHPRYVLTEPWVGYRFDDQST